MKRLLVVLAGALILAASPVLAGAPPAGAEPAHQPGLASPAEQPLFLTACQISKDCACGGGFVTISCTGNVSCTAQVNSITCDGRRISCLSVDCNPQAPEGN